MDHQGHGLALDHVIFNEPHKPAFDWIEVESPKRYDGARSPLHPQGLGETYQLAQFEIDKPDGWNPTLVSHEGFFTDIPGFENLAEGNSEKMLGSLSLARQGRYFYWGYSIDPERMTEGARDTLLNVLHYMRTKRDSLTVEFVCKTRKILQIYSHLGRDKGYLRGIEEHFPGQLTPKWQETYTPTWEGCAEWLDRYLPYVFSGKSEQHRGERYKTIFEVDEDALALGTPNAERSSLERWIELQGSDDAPGRERALRCLYRYVSPEIRPADGDWASWYEAQRNRIVFIESTGFWWQENPVVLEAEQLEKR
ncbi:MAG: hypothetical protein VYE77_08685 [Planctomycetota bacterium]|nr:hypothetical protein [Planctomycetota bacterium]